MLLLVIYVFYGYYASIQLTIQSMMIIAEHQWIIIIIMTITTMLAIMITPILMTLLAIIPVTITFMHI